MPSSLSYTRKFIILKRELSTVKSGNIKGHCKIEKKGPKFLLTVTVENGDIESIYNVALFTNNKQTPVTVLGKLFTDEMGKGKAEYTLTEKEMMGDFKSNGIIIMKDEDILLGGYIDKEDGSIERYINNLILESRIEEIKEVETKQVKEIEQIEETTKEITEEIEVNEIPLEVGEVEFNELIKADIEEVNPIEEVDSVEKVNTVEENTVEIFAEKISLVEEAFVEKITPQEEPVSFNEINYVEAFEPVKDASAEENTFVEEYFSIEKSAQEAPSVTKQSFYDNDSDELDYKTLDYLKRLNQKNQTVNYVLSILRFFPYAEPFKYNLKGYNWWLVDLDSVNEYKAFLPYFAHVIGGNNKEYYDSSVVTCTQLMNKYKHYLFGLYNEGEEVKYFLYGIPGTFTIGEHPYRGANGFNTWYEGVNAPGYWIIYIDPMTGKAVNLPNPMIPIT